MKKIKIILIIIILLAASLIPIMFLRQDSTPTTITTFQKGSMEVSDNGDATIEMPIAISDSVLSEMYEEAIDINGEDSFKEIFKDGIEEEYNTLLGIDLNVSDTQIIKDSDGKINIKIQGVAPQVGKFNYSKNNWEIKIGPNEKENGQAAELIINQMMFSQLKLKSKTGVQQLELKTDIPIALPKDATLLDTDSLVDQNWKLDFGGGTYRETTLSLSENKNEITMTETLFVSEETSKNAWKNETFQAIYDYRDFTIDYSMPGDAYPPTSVKISPPELAVIEKEDETCVEDFSFSFNAEFSLPIDEELSDTDGDVRANLNLVANPSFDFTFYLGWDIDWCLICWPPFLELDWFKTYFKFEPSFFMDLNSEITGGYNDPIVGETYDLWRWPVTVPVGIIPVTIEVKIDVTPGVNIEAGGEIKMDFMIDTAADFTIGAEWNSGWSKIEELNYHFIRNGPNIEIGGDVTFTPYTEFKLGAYIYGLVGPFITFTPKLEAGLTIDPPEWWVEAGFLIEAGVGFGSLADWLPLSDRRFEILDQTFPLENGAGEWDPDNTAPTLEFVSGPPSEGSTIDSYVYEVNYTDIDGNEPNYIRCRIDGSERNMTWVNGDIETGALYRYTWNPTSADVGTHTYYFDAFDGTATERLPETDAWYGPTLTLPWSNVSAGASYSIGTRISELWTWGFNENGQLGLGSLTNKNTPRKVPTPWGWRDISAGLDHFNAVRWDRAICAWSGPSLYYEVSDTDNWKSASAGDEHSIALRLSGTLWSWGGYNIPQLGQGLSSLGDLTQIGSSVVWDSISAGGAHSLALSRDGNLWAWGRNVYGQLGIGDYYDYWIPTQIGTDSDWEKISAGKTHSLALKSDGTLWGWGSNSGGMIGDGCDSSGSSTPTQIGTDSNWKEISAGTYHSLGLKTDGTLWSWGLNQFNELGLGDKIKRTTPTQIGTDNDWWRISAGDDHSLAIKTDQTLWAWGNNDYGQLGVGDFEERSTPTMVS